MKRIKGRDGVMREVDDAYILANGESFTVPLMMMDSRSILNDGNGAPVGQRPGFLVSDSKIDEAVRVTAYQMYADAIQQRWRSGRWQSGPSKPAPSAPMTFDGSAAARDAAYAQYRADIENRWRR